MSDRNTAILAAALGLALPTPRQGPPGGRGPRGPQGPVGRRGAAGDPGATGGPDNLVVVDDTLAGDEPDRRHFLTVAAALTWAAANLPGLPLHVALRPSAVAGHPWDGTLPADVPRVDFTRSTGSRGWTPQEYQPAPDIDLTGANLTAPGEATVSFHGLWLRGQWVATITTFDALAILAHGCYLEDAIQLDKGDIGGGLLNFSAFDCYNEVHFGGIDSDWSLTSVDVGDNGGTVECFLMGCRFSSRADVFLGHGDVTTSGQHVLELYRCALLWREAAGSVAPIQLRGASDTLTIRDSTIQIRKRGDQPTALVVDDGAGGLSVNPLVNVDVNVRANTPGFGPLADPTFSMFATGSLFAFDGQEGEEGTTVQLRGVDPRIWTLGTDWPMGTIATSALRETSVGPMLRYHRQGPGQGAWVGPNGERHLTGQTSGAGGTTTLADPVNGLDPGARLLNDGDDRIYRVKVRILGSGSLATGDGIDIEIDAVLRVDAAGVVTVLSQATASPGASGLNALGTASATLTTANSPAFVGVDVDNGDYAGDVEWIATVELVELARP